jgi:hypothetical protein
LRTALLRESLASVGVRLPAPSRRPFEAGGVRVPEGPFEAEISWKRLYEALSFRELVREEQISSSWVEDEYWAGLVGDVDLGRLRTRLASLDIPTEPTRIRLETVSDFDYKPRSLLKRFRRVSYRLRSIQGEHMVYYGNAKGLANELQQFNEQPFKVFVEVLSPDVVRMEVF